MPSDAGGGRGKTENVLMAQFIGDARERRRQVVAVHELEVASARLFRQGPQGLAAQPFGPEHADGVHHDAEVVRVTQHLGRPDRARVVHAVGNHHHDTARCFRVRGHGVDPAIDPGPHGCARHSRRWRHHQPGVVRPLTSTRHGRAVDRPVHPTHERPWIRGETRTDRGQSGKRPDVRAIARLEPPHQFGHSAPHQGQVLDHAAADIEHDDDGERHDVVAEHRNGSDIAVVANLEVVLGEIRDEPSVLVDHRGRHQYRVGRGAKDGLLSHSGHRRERPMREQPSDRRGRERRAERASECPHGLDAEIRTRAREP